MCEIREGCVFKDVLVGQGGMLFLYQGAQKQFDYLTGKEVPTTASAENFKNNIASRKGYFKENNILYKHVVFPSKPLLKTKFLPDEFCSISSLYENFYRPSLGQFSNDVFYPVEILKALEVEGVSTFKKLDTHNTDMAKYNISKELLSLIGGGDVKKISFSQKKSSGDLAAMLGLSDKNDEHVANICMGSYERVGNRDSILGNTDEVVIVTGFYESNKKRLLIFGDSFFKDLIPFLQYYFSDIMYVRSQFIHKELVRSFSPDVVFTGNAERYLSNVKSDDEARNFVLKLYGCNDYHPSSKYLKAFQAQLSYYYYKKMYLEYRDSLSENKFKNGCVIPKLEKWNAQLLPVDSLGKDILSFKSVGNDPMLFFEDVLFNESACYQLEIKVMSSTDSVLQLFYTTIFDTKLSESKSVKKIVKAGENNLVVEFPAKYLGRRFRLDPLSSVGEFDIIDIRIRERY